MSNCQKWWYCFWGLLIGVIIGFCLSLSYTYYAVGSIALIGGLLQGVMRKKAKAVVDFNSNGSKPPKISYPKDIHSKHNRGD